MIVFDELSFAKKMSEKGFIKCFSIYELSIYAKYLKYQNKTIEEIESELIAFSKKWNQDFIYDVDYHKIDKAIRSIDEYCLRVPISVNVTEKEWSVIMSLNDEKYRKVIFVMLVISKYFKYNNTKIVKENPDNNETENKYKDTYFCNFSDTDILKLAGVRFADKKERNKMFNYFYTKKYVDITQGKKSIRIVTIVDNDGETKETITDYNNIILYYERLIGVNIGECKECGRLFRQSKSNNGKYCFFHRGYQKQETKTITCIDCGEDVEVDAWDMKTKRCKECQYEEDKRIKREYYHKTKDLKKS